MIIGTKGRPLEKIVGEMKSFTSGILRKAIEVHPGERGKEWMLWMMQRAGLKNSNKKKHWQPRQQHNQPIELLTIEMFYMKRQYIHNNPVAAGFAEKEEEYLYSSAGDFHGKKGLIVLCYLV